MRPKHDQVSRRQEDQASEKWVQRPLVRALAHVAIPWHQALLNEQDAELGAGLEMTPTMRYKSVNELKMALHYPTITSGGSFALTQL